MSAPSPERQAQLSEFLARYGLAVQRMEVVDRALTHSSYAFEHQLNDDNERLEFLGDAVLGLLVSDYLYREHPQAPEGVLSKHKSAMISRSVLGVRAAEIGLGELLLLGRGEDMHGGRERRGLLGSALEALIGALYLELGIPAIERFLRKEVFEPARTLSTTDEFGDYKSLLQELVQKKNQSVPFYEIVSQSGPDHSKVFEVVVKLQGQICGRGTGARKKLAENQAAMRAYWDLTNAAEEPGSAGDRPDSGSEQPGPQWTGHPETDDRPD